MADDNLKDWTIMVYMAGDNNLSVDMAYTMRQIKDFVKGNKNINLFVYYDGYSPAIPTLYCDFSGEENRVYFRSKNIKDKIYPPDYPTENENSASAYSVINFVDWCVNKVEYKVGDETFKGRKAKKYAFIFSGHTSGFHSIGFLRDEKSNYNMTMPKVNWLLGRITKNADELQADVESEREYRRNKNWRDLSPEVIKQDSTVIIGQKLSFLGFDSCVMGMLEVGYQFKSAAEVMVASQGSIPNAGWTYTNLLGSLTKDKASQDVAEIAREFVTDFIYTQDSYTIGGVTVDLAAWNLTSLDALTEPFKLLIDNLIDCFTETGSLTYNQMKRVLLQVHWSCQTYQFEQNIDLSDFCWLLKNELESLIKELGERADPKYSTIIDLCGQVIAKVKECIILSGFSGGTYQYSNGIALFFPWSMEGYRVSKKNYEELIFVEFNEAGKQWAKFLKLYLGEVTMRPGKAPSKISAAALAAASGNGDGLTDASEDIAYLSYIYNNEKLYINETGSLDEKVETEIEDSRTTVNADNRTTVNADNRTTVNADNRTTVNADNRTTVNADNRTTVNADNRTTVNADNRTPVNADNRTTVNADNRTTVNADNRMFSNLNLFFSELFKFKNIETRWNISGFSKKPPSQPVDAGINSPLQTMQLKPGERINKDMNDWLGGGNSGGVLNVDADNK